MNDSVLKWPMMVVIIQSLGVLFVKPMVLVTLRFIQWELNPYLHNSGVMLYQLSPCEQGGGD